MMRADVGAAPDGPRRLGWERTGSTDVSLFLRTSFGSDRAGKPAATSQLPFGHGKHLATIPLGVQATLDADTRTLTIDQPGVRPPT
jgi:hypothetical protein